jgi:hypothetical protein
MTAEMFTRTMDSGTRSPAPLGALHLIWPILQEVQVVIRVGADHLGTKSDYLCDTVYISSAQSTAAFAGQPGVKCDGSDHPCRAQLATKRGKLLVDEAVGLLGAEERCERDKGDVWNQSSELVQPTRADGPVVELEDRRCDRVQGQL